MEWKGRTEMEWNGLEGMEGLEPGSGISGVHAPKQARSFGSGEFVRSIL